MIKKYLPFSLLVIKINLLVSLLTTFLAFTIAPKEITIDRLSYWFIISFLSGGCLLGILYFEIARNKEYYFYYNLGISKPKLILVTYLFHLIIALSILIAIHYAKQI